MILLDWYRDWLELKREYKSKAPCESCDTLKIQVEQLRDDNRKLLDRFMEKPTRVQEPVGDNVTPINTSRRQVPWRMRQQMLESNDRDIAKKLRNAPKPQPVAVSVTTQDLEDDVLEEELDNATRAREAEGQK